MAAQVLAVSVDGSHRFSKTPQPASELLDELVAQGFRLQPGDLGENILTGGIDLLALPAGPQIHLGEQAVVQVTGQVCV